MKNLYRVFISVVLIFLIVATYFYFRRPNNSAHDLLVRDWFRDPQAHPDWMVHHGEICESAAFTIPTDGFIGYIYNDSFVPGKKHQGIDIFSGTEPGITPVVAAYPGYLTRLPDWKSSLIIRIPDDPLQPGRQIWTYYTHMADPLGNSSISSAFPQGSREIPVKAGDLLGYQGNYSGDPVNPVGVHLHFSIVKDDGLGNFLNELEIANTIDPSEYFRINLNRGNNPGLIPLCLKNSMGNTGQ